jgi:hypothetical protein
VVSFPNSFLPWIRPRVFARGYVTLKAVMKMFRNRWAQPVGSPSSDEDSKGPHIPSIIKSASPPSFPFIPLKPTAKSER